MQFNQNLDPVIYSQLHDYIHGIVIVLASLGGTILWYPYYTKYQREHYYLTNCCNTNNY